MAVSGATASTTQVYSAAAPATLFETARTANVWDPLERPCIGWGLEQA